jgi:hypothetical protein
MELVSAADRTAAAREQQGRFTRKYSDLGSRASIPKTIPDSRYFPPAPTCRPRLAHQSALAAVNAPESARTPCSPASESCWLSAFRCW